MVGVRAPALTDEGPVSPTVVGEESCDVGARGSARWAPVVYGDAT